MRNSCPHVPVWEEPVTDTPDALQVDEGRHSTSSGARCRSGRGQKWILYVCTELRSHAASHITADRKPCCITDLEAAAERNLKLRQQPAQESITCDMLT
jgi:hypothetical protein